MCSTWKSDEERIYYIRLQWAAAESKCRRAGSCSRKAVFETVPFVFKPRSPFLLACNTSFFPSSHLSFVGLSFFPSIQAITQSLDYLFSRLFNKNLYRRQHDISHTRKHIKDLNMFLQRATELTRLRFCVFCPNLLGNLASKNFSNLKLALSSKSFWKRKLLIIFSHPGTTHRFLYCAIG